VAVALTSAGLFAVSSPEASADPDGAGCDSSTLPGITVCYQNDSDPTQASVSASGTSADSIDLIVSFNGTTEQTTGTSSVTLVGAADFTGADVSVNGGPLVNFQPGPSFN
jgi:hypothetical protein